MKKWLPVLTFTFFLIFAGLFYWKKSVLQPPANKVLPAIETPISTPRILKQSTILNIDGVPIRISWTMIQPEEAELYSNLKEQKLSEEIKVNKKCQILVNGGFYSEDQTHLGLFVSNFEIISKPIQNATLNGFLWIDSNETVTVSPDPPNTTPRLGLQSGPLLVQNKTPLVLSIKDDESSRRIVAAVTQDNHLYFLAVYRDNSEYQGPLLGNLPKIIDLFGKKNNIEIFNAINLDGGSASVFVTNYDLLRELAHVGSYFCIK